MPKRRATHEIENDERTASTHRNINGNPGHKETEQTYNVNNDDKENECPDTKEIKEARPAPARPVRLISFALFNIASFNKY